MDRELMEKEVLCILDTRQIQRYMFRTNSFMDTIGGSDLLDHITMDALEDAMKSVDPPLREDEYVLSQEPTAEDIPYFTTPGIKFQLIICAAGNAICIVRTGALCQKIIRRISRYYLEAGYSLNLTAAATERTDNYGQDVSRLYQKLKNIKASSEISDPMGTLPVIMREKRTGEPVIAFDEERGDYVSRSSVIRRTEAKGRVNCVEMKDMHVTKAADGKSYLAFIHADGNNLGITIGRIMQATSGYVDAIVTRRIVAQNIETAYIQVMEKTTGELKAYYQKKGGRIEEFPHEFQVLHQAGDDINIMCNANLAFPFLDFFYQNLKDATIWEKDGERIPLYVCAGISFVDRESSFHASYHMAEECCSSAKAKAKEERHLQNGLAGNWIDFQVCENPNVQELDMLRTRSYHTAEGIDLMLRPYSLEPADREEPFYYETLMERVQRLKKLHLPAVQMSLLRQSYTMGRQEYTRWIRRMKEKGYNLAESLGSPIYTDTERISHAVWFDAVELMDFLGK